MKIFYSLLVVISLQIHSVYGQPTLEELITQIRTHVKVIKYDDKLFTMETVEKWQGATVGLAHHTILEFNSSESGRLAIDFCKVTCISIQVSKKAGNAGDFVVCFTGNEVIERYGKTFNTCEFIVTNHLFTDSTKTGTENLILLLKYFCCN